MRNQFLIFIVLYCIAVQTINAQTKNCTLLIKIDTLSHSDFSFIAIADSKLEYYLDTIGSKLDSICLFIDEPQKVSLQIGNITPKNINTNILPLWLHKGRYFVHLNLVDNKVFFENSSINTVGMNARNYLDSLRNLSGYKPKLDSLYALSQPSDSDIQLIEMYSKDFEEEEKIITEKMYKYHSKNKSSYLALDFISFHLGTNYKYIAKEKLKKLFGKLDKSLRIYKKYNDCKRSLNKTLTEPPKPLYNIKI